MIVIGKGKDITKEEMYEVVKSLEALMNPLNNFMRDQYYLRDAEETLTYFKDLLKIVDTTIDKHREIVDNFRMDVMGEDVIYLA